MTYRNHGAVHKADSASSKGMELEKEHEFEEHAAFKSHETIVGHNRRKLGAQMLQSTVMKEHKTAFPIVVQPVEGDILSGVNGQNLKKGDLIAIDGNVPHDLKANEDSILRLTLNKQGSALRVARMIAAK